MSALEPDQLRQLGVSEDEARDVARAVESVVAEYPERARRPEEWARMWQRLSGMLLERGAGFDVCRAVYELACKEWDTCHGPPPAWSPSRASVAVTHVGRFMEEMGFTEYRDLHAWSTRERSEFWERVVGKLGVVFKMRPQSMVNLDAGVTQPEWLPGAAMNIVDSCFGAPADKTAIVHQDEGEPMRRMTYGDLERLVNRVANGLCERGFVAGDAIAIDMAMTAESVAIYLGIIKAGCCVVSIADSFAPEEIATRLRLSKAKAIFTADYYIRRGKRTEIYSKVKKAGPVPAIVLCCDESEADTVELREGDVLWRDFLAQDDVFESVACEPGDHTNILFSSGTTGDPKAIPWTHTTPIKCAMDALFHHNVTE
ncbi:MAG: AMP-binding protein, partial [Phycisphaerales bacterium]